MQSKSKNKPASAMEKKLSITDDGYLYVLRAPSLVQSLGANTTESEQKGVM